MAYLPTPALGTSPATRASIVEMIRAAKGVPAAANATERGTITSLWPTATGAPISAANPVMVWRSDFGRMEYSHNGTTWLIDGAETYVIDLTPPSDAAFSAAALVGGLTIPRSPRARIIEGEFIASARTGSGAWFLALSNMQPNVSGAQRRSYTLTGGQTGTTIVRLRSAIPPNSDFTLRGWVSPAVAGQMTLLSLPGSCILSAVVHPQGGTVAPIG